MGGKMFNKQKRMVGKIYATVCDVSCDSVMQNELADAYYEEVERRVLAFAREQGYIPEGYSAWITNVDNKNILVYKVTNRQIIDIGEVQLVEREVAKQGDKKTIESTIYLIL